MHFPLPSSWSGLSITYTNRHPYTPTGGHAHTPAGVRRHTYVPTHTRIPLPLVFRAGIGADMSGYPGAADPVLRGPTLFESDCCSTEAKKKAKVVPACLTLKPREMQETFLSPHSCLNLIGTHRYMGVESTRRTYEHK